RMPAGEVDAHHGAELERGFRLGGQARGRCRTGDLRFVTSGHSASFPHLARPRKARRHCTRPDMAPPMRCMARACRGLPSTPIRAPYKEVRDGKPHKTRKKLLK